MTGLATLGVAVGAAVVLSALVARGQLTLRQAGLAVAGLGAGVIAAVLLTGDGRG